MLKLAYLKVLYKNLVYNLFSATLCKLNQDLTSSYVDMSTNFASVRIFPGNSTMCMVTSLVNHKGKSLALIYALSFLFSYLAHWLRSMVNKIIQRTFKGLNDLVVT